MKCARASFNTYHADIKHRFVNTYTLFQKSWCGGVYVLCAHVCCLFSAIVLDAVDIHYIFTPQISSYVSAVLVVADLIAQAVRSQNVTRLLRELKARLLSIPERSAVLARIAKRYSIKH